MKRVALAAALIASLSLSVSCTETSFSGASSAGEEAKPEPESNDGAVGATDDPGPEGASAAVCVPADAGVNVMVLLDVSGSMQPSYVFVFRAINALVASFQGIIPEGATKPLSNVTVGMVVFKDVEDNEFAVLPLTQDPAALKTQLAPYEAKIGGGGDGPEQGLYAFTKAMDHIETTAKGAPVIPVIMMISDNYAHNDSVKLATHDYSLDPSMARFAKKPFDSIFIYDFTPSMSPETARMPWASPAAQWQAVRDSWKKTYPSVNRQPGKSFGFSFPRTAGVTTSTPLTDEEKKFQTEIIADLTKDLSNALKSCTP